MTTILWARRSKEDATRRGSGVESVAVQIENARDFARARGWDGAFSEVVAEGESGAEIHRRPDVQQVLSLVRNSGARRVVVRDLDRIARNALWQTWLLAELDRAGVELWTYTDGGRPEIRGLGFAMTALRSVMAEGERAQTAKRIREALRARVQQGHAVGARRFGYKTSGDVAKQWEKNEDEAELIVHVGQLFVKCGTLRGTAVQLNDEGVPSPGGGTWNHVTVKHLLTADLPRGYLVHGAVRSVERGGTLVRVRAPEGEVLRIEHPELKILPDDLIAQIDALLTSRRRVVRGAAQPRHLGSSFLACGLCGSCLTASGSDLGGTSYVCVRHVQHGRRACEGIGYRSERAVDAALLAAVAPLVNRKRVLAELQGLLDRRSLVNAAGEERTRLAKALSETERKSRNVALAIASDDHPPLTLVTMVRELDERARNLRNQIEALNAEPPSSLETRKLLSRARARLDELGTLLGKGGVAARPVLAAVLGSKRFTATRVEIGGQRRWQLRATVSRGWLISNVGKDPSASSPRCRALRASTSTSQRSRPWTRRASFGPWPA